MSRLTVERLTKEFPTRAEPLVVLRGVSLELASGENLAITGPSGSDFIDCCRTGRTKMVFQSSVA